MRPGRPRARFLPAAALTGTLLCLTAACGAADTASPANTGGRGTRGTGTAGTVAWQEPASYSYTLTSTTSVLAGTFRVDVREGTVAKVVGLDEDSRRQARERHLDVPTIGGLLKKLEQARGDDAETAQATYASDGHPVRISLDYDKNTIDDEALYVISAYRPMT
ncbi:DUF6174 domain-containing protein [Streptomyces sp. NPDC015171]|uniref:DUF6174 domain-containing protein n=1 Tax=Streptomyces sp. NPDC015171 TaxID=3364945 RepID=UPI0036FBE39E